MRTFINLCYALIGAGIACCFWAHAAGLDNIDTPNNGWGLGVGIILSIALLVGLFVDAAYCHQEIP